MQVELLEEISDAGCLPEIVPRVKSVCSGGDKAGLAPEALSVKLSASECGAYN